MINTSLRHRGALAAALLVAGACSNAPAADKGATPSASSASSSSSGGTSFDACGRLFDALCECCDTAAQVDACKTTQHAEQAAKPPTQDNQDKCASVLYETSCTTEAPAAKQQLCSASTSAAKCQAPAAGGNACSSATALYCGFGCCPPETPYACGSARTCHATEDAAFAACGSSCVSCGSAPSSSSSSSSSSGSSGGTTCNPGTSGPGCCRDAGLALPDGYTCGFDCNCSSTHCSGGKCCANKGLGCGPYGSRTIECCGGLTCSDPVNGGNCQ